MLYKLIVKQDLRISVNNGNSKWQRKTYVKKRERERKKRNIEKDSVNSGCNCKSFKYFITEVGRSWRDRHRNTRENREK